MKSNFSIAEIAQHIDAKIVGDDQLTIDGIAPLDLAQPGQLSFLKRSSYLKLLPETKASAVIIKEPDLEQCPVVALVVRNPELAAAKAAAAGRAVRRAIGRAAERLRHGRRRGHRLVGRRPVRRGVLRALG